MKRVCILTPSYDGKVVCDHAVHLATIFSRAAKDPDLELSLRYWMYGAVIQQSRNNLFCDAYEAGYDEIVFMDADQAVDAQAFFDLLSHPVDVVGLTARMKTDAERYNHRPEDNAAHTWNASLKLLHVKYLPMGYLRLTRKAMTALYEASPVYWDEGKQRRLICNVTIEDNGLISEDIHLCTKLNNAGFNCYLDTQHTCDHFGTKKYTGDYRKQYAKFVLSNMLVKTNYKD